MNRSETENKINIRAWKDPAFKKKLLSHPSDALKELGMKNLPSSIKIRVIEEGKNEWCIVLHSPPPNIANMSEKELKNWNAAGCGVPGKCNW